MKGGADKGAGGEVQQGHWLLEDFRYRSEPKSGGKSEGKRTGSLEKYFRE